MIDSNYLESCIEKIKIQAKVDEKLACEQAKLLSEEFSNEWRVWDLRAYISARSGNYVDAINDISCAIYNESKEPCLFFDRGRFFLKIKNYIQAEHDFTAAIDLCYKYNDDYYLQSCLFLRAFSYLNLGNKNLARADLEKIDDDYSVWIDGMVTKKDLWSQCF